MVITLIPLDQPILDAATETTMCYLHHKSCADDRDDHREMALDDRERIGHTLEGERNQQEPNREARGVESEHQRAARRGVALAMRRGAR